MKYYAVRAGRAPGIYESWTECKEQTAGYPGAIFKSFTELEAAENYMQAGAVLRTPIKKDLPAAYIDGSFSKTAGRYSWGGYIDNAGHITIIQGTGSNPDYLPERNIAGELMGALQVMFKATQMGLKEINLYYDYAGIENWPAGSWRAKTPLTRYYAETVDLVSYDLQVNFIKVKGHTGIEGNEIADYLAKEAAGAHLLKRQEKALQDFRAKAYSL